MAHDRTRCGRIEPQPARPRGGHGQCHVNIAPPVRMIRHANAVEARVLAAGDEIRHVGDGRPYWNPKVDLYAMSGHSFSFLTAEILPCYRSEVQQAVPRRIRPPR